jgi:hypothetical protein
MHLLHVGFIQATSQFMKAWTNGLTPVWLSMTMICGAVSVGI